MVIFPRTLYKTLLSVCVQSKNMWTIAILSCSQVSLLATYKRNSFTLENPDPPEFFSDGRLEIGGCIAENLALLLDPYPRDPDAVLPDFMKASADGVDVDLEPIERSLKNLRKMMHNKNR